jgi:uncharacterized protein DUF4267
MICKPYHRGTFVASMTILETSSWHLLGLSVAVSYAGLGLLQCALPRFAAKTLLDVGSQQPGNNKRTDAVTGRATEDTTVPLVMPLLGARDLTIAAALFTFSWQDKTREMGTLILAGTILCVADVAAVWKRQGSVL